MQMSWLANFIRWFFPKELWLMPPAFQKLRFFFIWFLAQKSMNRIFFSFDFESSCKLECSKWFECSYLLQFSTVSLGVILCLKGSKLDLGYASAREDFGKLNLRLQEEFPGLKLFSFLISVVINAISKTNVSICEKSEALPLVIFVQGLKNNCNFSWMFSQVSDCGMKLPTSAVKLFAGSVFVHAVFFVANLAQKGSSPSFIFVFFFKKHFVSLPRYKCVERMATYESK